MKHQKKAATEEASVLASLKSPGRPTVFSREEEEVLTGHILAVATYGFPLCVNDLKVIVKSYLEKCGRNVSIFKYNLPGSDWVKLFMGRHPEISQRAAKNISLSRASVDKTVIEDYFKHFEKEVEGVPPSNIYNYDETNFVDDPGCPNVLVKRGTKYPELIRNATKACTTVMMCGNAAGDLVPPYVIYRAENVYNTWTEGGPPGCRYHRSKSGWIDSYIFADWFENHFLPFVRRQQGKKVLLGDNLSSHFNVDVIKKCEENDIVFVALAPNATHLLQPLDVAFFRPLKVEWRKTLDAWKVTPQGRRCGTVPKDMFPKLLKTTLENLEPRSNTNLQAGFRKCGIFPLDPNKVLERLSDSVCEKSDFKDKIHESFVEHLKNIRTECVAKKPRKKKLIIQAGKGITADDLKDPKDVPAVPSKKKKGKGQNVKPKGKKRTRRASYESECSTAGSLNSDDLPYAESDESPLNFESDMSDEEDLLPIDSRLLPTLMEKPLIEGDYVAVVYGGRKYPGKVVQEEDGEFEVTCMKKSGKWWTWPQEEDKLWFNASRICCRIRIPRIIPGEKVLFSVDLKP